MMFVLYMLLLLSAERVWWPAGRLLASVRASEHFLIPGMPKKNVTALGDINVAVVYQMTNFQQRSCVIKHGPLQPGETSYVDCSSLDKPHCEEDDVIVENIWFPNMVQYIVNEINTNDTWKLPNNLTLGYILLDSCDKDTLISAHALSFLKLPPCSEFDGTCQADSNANYDPENVLAYHDVVGLVCCDSSVRSIAASFILGPAFIPVVSSSSTSDELSHIEHDYFFRTATPDVIQFDAIVRLIRYYNWTYISAIYIAQSYGENGVNKLKYFLDQVNDREICLAKLIKASTDVTVEEAHQIALQLFDTGAAGPAKIIVLIHSGNINSIHTIVKQVSKVYQTNYRFENLVWVGTDGVSYRLNYTDAAKELLLGSFCTVLRKTAVPQFYEVLNQTKLTDALLINPWLSNATQTLFNCTPSQCSPDLTLGQRRYTGHKVLELGEQFDAFLMLANGISRVLNQCPNQGRECIDGKKLREALYTTDIIGYSGRIALKNKERSTNYDIGQWVREDKVIVFRTVAVFNPETTSLEFLEDGGLVQWPDKWAGQPPDGRCGDAPVCAENERKSYLDVRCCWTCQPCKRNEILNPGRSRCVPCAKYEWPDETNRTAPCRKIPVKFVSLESRKGLWSFVLVMVMLPVYLCVCAVLLYYRNTRVVVYHNKLFAVFMLLGIGTGYAFVLQQFAQSSEILCHFAYLFLCLSFALIYCPLMLRTLDNYRAFRTFESQTEIYLYERMCFRTQLAATLVFISIELLSAATMMGLLEHEWKVKNQSASEPFVEEGCSMPEEALWLFMVFTMMFLCSSAVLSVITRFVPHDVYNEARCISMSFSAAIIILLCFFPAYLVSEGVVLKEVMLSLVVCLNHTLALGFLAGSSLYALVYMKGARDVLSPSEQLAPFSSMFSTERSQSWDTVDCHAWSISGQQSDM